MKIPGILMRPCSMTEEENEKVMRSSGYFTESDFYDKYRKNIVTNQLIAESAKIYIRKNYQAVTDWSGLDVLIRFKGGSEHYYKQRGPGPGDKEYSALSKMLAERKKNEKPVVSFTDPVLDPTDGDFSVTINGKELWWIDDDAIVTIADYIEKKLKPNDDRTDQSPGEAAEATAK